MPTEPRFSEVCELRFLRYERLFGDSWFPLGLQGGRRAWSSKGWASHGALMNLTPSFVLFEELW